LPGYQNLSSSFVPPVAGKISYIVKSKEDSVLVLSISQKDYEHFNNVQYFSDILIRRVNPPTAGEPSKREWQARIVVSTRDDCFNLRRRGGKILPPSALAGLSAKIGFVFGEIESFIPNIIIPFFILSWPNLGILNHCNCKQ
jgi:hypothetical protein